MNLCPWDSKIESEFYAKDDCMSKYRNYDTKYRNQEESLAGSYTENVVSYLYYLCVERRLPESMEINLKTKDKTHCSANNLNEDIDIEDLLEFCRRIINETVKGINY